MNVTPLIDILLVLLVIFMATLPIAQEGLDTSVPPETQSKASQVITNDIVLEVEVDRSLFINKQAVRLPDLQARLSEIYSSRRDKTLFVDGDEKVKYALIVQVIDAAKSAGVTKIGMITPAMKRAAGLSPTSS